MIKKRERGENSFWVFEVLIKIYFTGQNFEDHRKKKRVPPYFILIYSFYFQRKMLINNYNYFAAFSLGTEIIQPKPGCNKICPKVWLPICAFAPGPSEFRTFGSRCEMENENCECNHSK